MAKCMKLLTTNNGRLLTQAANDNNIQQSDIVDIKIYQGQWYLFYYGAD